MPYANGKRKPDNRQFKIVERTWHSQIIRVSNGQCTIVSLKISIAFRCAMHTTSEPEEAK
jgi:hypothetical protein